MDIGSRTAVTSLNFQKILVVLAGRGAAGSSPREDYAAWPCRRDHFMPCPTLAEWHRYLFQLTF
jgi:hypothetical protein